MCLVCGVSRHRVSSQNDTRRRVGVYTKSERERGEEGEREEKGTATTETKTYLKKTIRRKTGEHLHRIFTESNN